MVTHLAERHDSFVLIVLMPASVCTALQIFQIMKYISDDDKDICLLESPFSNYLLSGTG